MGTEEDISNLQDRLDQMVKNNDQFFLVVIAIIIFFMQCGFAFLEAGSVRSKNTVNILIKNMLDAFIGGVSYWAIGWGLAYGNSGNPFCGGSEFFNYNLSHDLYPKWFFQFVFAATAATIVSGAIAERCQFAAYFVYSIIITAWVYPPVSHWAWDGGNDMPMNVTDETTGITKEMMVTVGKGWLAETGYYKDFAGSGVVHLLGGTCALVGCYFMGARKGRFNKQGEPIDMPGHSVPLAALGGFILIFGFLAFNGGSQAAINSSPGDGAAVGLAIVNTILGGCSGGLAVLFLNRMLGTTWSFLMTLNGALAGMVALCAGCDSYEPWAALLVGCGAGVCFVGAHFGMLKAQLDDPLDAVAVHGAGGLWGLLIVPFLWSGHGIFWTGGDENSEGWLTLGYNLAGAVAIIVWSAFWSTAMFFPLSYFRVFRIPRDMEFQGVDIIKHGEAAYPAAAWEEVQYGSNANAGMGLPVHMRGGNRTATSAKKADDAYNNPFEMMPATGKLFSGMTTAFQGLANVNTTLTPPGGVANSGFEKEGGIEEKDGGAPQKKEKWMENYVPYVAPDNGPNDNKAMDNKAFEAEENEKETV